jgi:capsular polysaccharide biosynthesis protein
LTGWGNIPSRVRRRVGIIALATLCCAGVTYALSGTVAKKYSAEAVVVVASSRQVTPDQANRLAITDAALIPKDEAIGRHLAAELGTTISEVRRRLSVTNDPETALLRIDYRGATASDARSGAIAVARSITGSNPESNNIAPKSIEIVQLPNRVSAASSLGTLMPVAVILGLALGAVLAVAAERADPRIDDLEDLAAAVSCPVSRVDGLSSSAASALLTRWTALAGLRPISVALLPVDERFEPSLPPVARTLALADERERAVVIDAVPELPSHSVRTESQGVQAADLRLLTAGVPGGTSAGEGVALGADLTVLVLEPGTRLAKLRNAVEVLANFGTAPAWAVLVSREALVLEESPSVPQVAELPAARAR